MKLTNELKGSEVVINKLNFQDPHILHKLDNIGISRGVKVKVLEYSTDLNVIHLLVYGVHYVLREDEASNIDVTPKE